MPSVPGIWEGSYVEAWLFRVCIREGGKPEACSNDANAHPRRFIYSAAA